MKSLVSVIGLDHKSPKHAIPRDALCDEIEWHLGKAWARNFPRICPVCHRTFFGWAPQPWPSDWEPDAIESDRSQTLGGGHRSTCGRPNCHEAAWKEHAVWSEQEWASISATKREREALLRIDQEAREKTQKAGRF